MMVPLVTDGGVQETKMAVELSTVAAKLNDAPGTVGKCESEINAWL